MPLISIDDKSTLIQVRDRCYQAASPYLIKCKPRSMSHGITRTQLVQGKIMNSQKILIDIKSSQVQVLYS